MPQALQEVVQALLELLLEPLEPLNHNKHYLLSGACIWSHGEMWSQSQNRGFKKLIAVVYIH